MDETPNLGTPDTATGGQVESLQDQVRCLQGDVRDLRSAMKALVHLQEAVASFEESFEQVGSTITESLDEVKTSTREEAKQSRKNVLLASMASIIGIAVIILLSILVFRSFGNQPVIDKISDCTTPSGECSRETAAASAARTAPFVDGILKRIDHLQQVVCETADPQRRPPECPR